MHVGIIFFLVILGSVLFHIFTPWYWTDVASNWGGMDDTITLTFWIGGGVFIAVCLFMIYCVFKFSYKKERKAEYKPEDKKLEILAVILILVLLFYFVISFGAGAFSKKETNSRTKKYLKSVNILLSIIAVVGVILVLFL